jgi:hypothetical protein
MMGWKDVGKYLDRKVLFQEAEHLSDLTLKDVSKALILLWLGNPSWRYEDLTALIDRLAREGVLGITVAGKQTDESFDALIETIGSMMLPKHVMTGVDDSDDVDELVSSFFVAAIPDEARWDDWREYRIIAVGRSEQTQRILDSIHEWLLFRPE